MAYKKFSIYGGVKISERAISAAIIIGFIALAALMVIGNRIGFTASFESAGQVVEVQHLHYGERVERPSDPTRAGYDFKGWYSDEMGTVKYDFSRTDISGDITIYASWERAGEAVSNIPTEHFYYSEH